jgi:hypothetical protein
MPCAATRRQECHARSVERRSLGTAGHLNGPQVRRTLLCVRFDRHSLRERSCAFTPRALGGSKSALNVRAHYYVPRVEVLGDSQEPVDSFLAPGLLGVAERGQNAPVDSLESLRTPDYRFELAWTLAPVPALNAFYAR